MLASRRRAAITGGRRVPKHHARTCVLNGSARWASMSASATDLEAGITFRIWCMERLNLAPWFAKAVQMIGEGTEFVVERQSTKYGAVERGPSAPWPPPLCGGGVLGWLAVTPHCAGAV